ncbi:histone-lysine N-methyltransferase SUVR5 [Ricinus communis]|uniref:Set domain protein, putative n=1 Tax=Ricinus communis TaxID=3988 RepID=B9S8S4_RICCO|nr:histone-lysine N-methyltransferase SUVR5 [Ricinus communis]XP_015576741.1 histone-lysine N-methyltransferase SUVR5 [Ricinus communis]XP_025013713.1 histone-lysine N-methyltransferase SUVR5 [Ricinus communis]EEF40077.1 set domain protein, putative [Ricinus communis]|eukprot:XP_002522393.1 histone-lysine N-methyltransferase SUVR5 [Ricinus communis]
MEVLPCSGVQYVEEVDCAQQNSGAGCNFDRESNGFEHGQQVQMADARVDNVSVHVEGPQIERRSEGQGIAGELPISDGHQNGVSYSDCQVDSQRVSGDSHDFEDDDINVQNYCTEPCEAPDNCQVVVDTIDSDLSNSRDGESSVSEPKWLEHDESVALWVKWRGKWQAGIRCARADWPLSTLRAKPTHDRKKYFVIFFPHTRNYSWADMLLVRSINEFPHPIAYRTHKIGLKMVKDLNVARRFIMKKLAVGMLNIIDQFHTEALIETARDVMVWKEFAMEASRCTGYSDLGRMLLKLQNMIFQRYIKSDWLAHSFQSWMQRCQVAQSAESVELLREELSDSILWNEVNSLWNAPVQPTLGSEWKTWKHEVMKWFSTSRPVSSSGDLEQRSCDSPSTVSLQVGRKRPKLEVRRAEPHASQIETSSPLQTMTVEIDTEFFNNRDSINATAVASSLSKDEDFGEGAAPLESPCSVADRWDEIVVEARNSDVILTKDVERTPVSEAVDKKTIDHGNKNRQCIAFIESKGRQCVRWANDGDVYCCVHLASRFIGSSIKAEASPPVNSPMCEGTTVLGTRCKHRSLPGASFCKKHGPRGDTTNVSNSSENALKRRHEEIVPGSETAYCQDIVLVGEVESPLQVEPVSVMDGDAFHERNRLNEKLEHSSQDHNVTVVHHCIGSSPFDINGPCHESPKRYLLYCDKHIPSWLKRARNGKSRIIPKEVFADLLKDCHSLDQKMRLHQACELFYKLFKSILSLRNPVPMEIQLQWALSEASKDFGVGELLLKLVCTEKDRLMKIWGFRTDEAVDVSSSATENTPILPLTIDGSHVDEKSIKCKFCSEEFLDDQELGNHWMDNHKKEVQWLFRGYACAICLDSFTNRKLLENHVQETHHVEFVEQCMLLQCIPCGSHFGNAEELWLHVLSIHPVEFRLSKVVQQHNIPLHEGRDDSVQKLDQCNMASVENNTENLGGIRKFICRFCGLKFDLLPDLGRHHQAAHMGPNLLSSRPPKRGIRYYAYRLKSGRLSRPRFKKGLGAATYRIRNRGSAALKKRIQASKSLSTGGFSLQPPLTDSEALGRLAETHCSSVAQNLFSEIQKTKPRPNNLDILAAARSTCCKVSLKASLEGKYGVLPERLYLKAAKLCSEHNIRVQWHRDGFLCPRGCKSFKDPGLLLPLMPLPNSFIGKQSAHSSGCADNGWEIDECHYVIGLHDFTERPRTKVTILCNDISFGKESIPITCVVDEDMLASLNVYDDGQITNLPMPWECFTYITRPLLDQFHNPNIESLQLGCACPHSSCCPGRCDHVYLFDNDYEDAKDIYGKPMHGRFPYDDKGRIILEEGYLVYECNQMCSCSKTCPNRVLQNGIRVKLEVYKTKNKGWAVRAGEPILSGTFVCEYIGEVLDEVEANQRRGRYSEESCSYMYDIDAHTNDMSRLMEGQVKYVIDATKHGNVSRFINHSCLPNLVNHQVIINSMDAQRAHIGLYASRDIAFGEELTYNYRYNLVPGEGYPCHCGTSKCRGRLC